MKKQKPPSMSTLEIVGLIAAGIILLLMIVVAPRSLLPWGLQE